MSTIVIVSASADVPRALRAALLEAGHESAVVASLDEALAHVADRAPDLLIVDLERAGATGLEAWRRLRADPRALRLPVIALTPDTREEDRLAAFELGLDDLVTKPFSVREVVLRVRAVLRRARASHGGAAPPARAGPIELDLAAHRAFVDGAEVALTPLEFRLLTRLVRNAGRVQSRRELLEEVWNVAAGVETRTIDTHVKRLRTKLGPAHALLETIRGVGYRLASTGGSADAPASHAALR